ncbi:MAG TPA: hypothetical protein VEF34_12220 [Syntrophobacteraceae bacterium]|nr:hypothetical protein [Syntrophobacteraceae bacterium]
MKRVITLKVNGDPYTVAVYLWQMPNAGDMPPGEVTCIQIYEPEMRTEN